MEHEEDGSHITSHTRSIIPSLHPRFSSSRTLVTMVLSTNKLAVAAIMAGAAAAAPAPAVKPGRFSVPQVRNENFKRNGPLQIAKTYLKYGKPVPADLAKTLGWDTNGKRDTGSETTTPEEYDSEYLTPVSIGTPAQVLNLDFDSGSSDLWVFSTDTASSEINGQTTYDPDASSTSKQLSGYTWDISYGDGSSSSGIVYTDKVEIGGLTVTSQAVEAAETVSSAFTSEGNLDGLLGLAFSKLNTVSPKSQNTWFDNIKSDLDSPLWAVDLKHDEPGTYDFGFIDDSKYTGDITYADVSMTLGYWTFTSSGYQVGDSKFTSTNIKGIADTGTTLLYLPDSILETYYAQISSAKSSTVLGGYIFDCDDDIPDFTFGVGSARITVPAEYISYANVLGNKCLGGIQSSSDIGLNIFGDIALKSAYVVFDSDGPQIGWAAKDL
ncbi:secreted aspartic proteinase precursor [Xylariaceae sp. FL0016]|nr:secreted aspartic proteinase precursor [Xylariaceae sp. FL0016]